MDRNDILILLRHELSAVMTNPTTIKFDAIDEKLGLDPGTTKENLHDGAAKAGLEVIEEGQTLAVLRKIPAEPSRLQRG